MDERSTAWLSVGRAAVPDSIKQAVLSVFPDPIDALKADVSAMGSSRQSVTPKKTLAGFVRHDELRRDIEWLSAPGRSVLGVSDPRFSRLLREIPNPPTVIYCEGELDLLDQPAVAVVGSRSPTPVGCESAMRFAGAMGDHQVTVVSGLALGIDSVAHRGALHTAGSTIAVCATGLDTVYPRCHRNLAREIKESGLILSEFPPGTGVRRHHFPQRNRGALHTAGSTIAVCATGLDTVYPRCHRNLAREIKESGLILSEFPPGTGVRRHHFPQRNRLISGLSLGTLIVEAGLGSGSLITAGFAADQGREVFALPGSVNSPLSRGPHQLIRDGACLVETPSQILEALSLAKVGQIGNDDQAEKPAGDGGILDFVDFAPTPINKIAQRSGLTIAKISAMLIRVELQGLVKTCAGGYIRLR